MSLVTFGEPWGFVKNSRDERNILGSFRESLVLFGFAGRCRGFRDNMLKYPPLAKLFLPTASDEHGAGYLIGQAHQHVNERQRKIEEEGFSMEKPDFMQYALEATIDGEPLSPAQKHAQVLILIQAGADTTGTALGSTLNFLLAHPSSLARVRAEIDKADAAGLLSNPIQYEETQKHLPYMIACIKEGGLRLRPPATNLFTRVVGPGGSKIGRVYLPEGFEVTTNAYVVQRDLQLFGPDPEDFRPERWLEADEKRLAEMEAAMFMFGTGSRVCIGKNIATFELYKLLPEIVRRFDMELMREGLYVVAGGVAYNKDLVVNLRVRGE